MITVYGTKPSRTFRVLWALEELGLEYTFEKTFPQSEGMYAVNPLGQAPAMRDGDDILTDSVAILNYLADRHGALTYPPGTPARARLDARMNFLVTEVDAPIWLMGRHGFVLPEEQRMPGMRPIAEADLARAELKFTTLLDGAEFFGGDSFSIVDIVAGHTLNWIGNAKVALTQPAVQDYLTRLQARPAWDRVQNL